MEFPSASGASKRRPNRTASERRAQQERAQVRFVAKMIKLERAMLHRGNTVPRAYASIRSEMSSQPQAAPSESSMQQLQSTSGPTSSSSQVPLHPPSQHSMKKYSFLKPAIPLQTDFNEQFRSQGLVLASHSNSLVSIDGRLSTLQDMLAYHSSTLQVLSNQIFNLESIIAAHHAPSGQELSGQFNLADLVDESTLQRIRASQNQSLGTRSQQTSGNSNISVAAVSGPSSHMPSIVSQNDSTGVAASSSLPSSASNLRNHEDAGADAAAKLLNRVYLRQNASEPDDGFDTHIWWSCPSCSYQLPLSAQFKSQKKFQHMKTHQR